VTAALGVTLAGLEPFHAELGTFLATVSPLGDGERLLAAPPFVLVVR
jgi:hypothetical protein